MLLIRKNAELLNYVLRIRDLRQKINFIPTMGNLHEGHLHIIRKAKKQTNKVIVSIFINPLQFNDKKDYLAYPRTPEIDKKLLQKESVDLLYLPNFDFIPKNSDILNLGDISNKLCGIERKGHFEGVGTVILRFLEVLKPDNIFLGEKDFQQLLIIKKIIKDYKYSTKVKIVKTVRDENKIALSSRNKLLKQNLIEAKILPNTIFKIKNLIESGNFYYSELEKFRKLLQNKDDLKLNYIEVLKETNLGDMDYAFSKCRVFISAKIHKVRLIDNIGIAGKYKLSEGRLLKQS